MNRDSAKTFAAHSKGNVERLSNRNVPPISASNVGTEDLQASSDSRFNFLYSDAVNRRVQAVAIPVKLIKLNFDPIQLKRVVSQFVIQR